MSDQDELMKQFATGSKKAFTIVYEEQYGAIYYLAKRLLNDAEMAADITADSFFKLWRLHNNFDSIQAIRAFLQVTTRNACFDHLRNAKYRENTRKELLYLLSQDASEEIVDFGKDERKAMFMNRVYEAIKSLPKKCGRVFELAYLDGMRNQEIARVLNINEKTVRNQKYTAIKLLRGLIHQDTILDVVVLFSLAHLPSFIG